MDLLTLDLSGSMNTADLKALIQSESNVPPTSQHIYHNGQLLNDQSKTLEELGIGDGEMLAMHVRDMIGDTGVPSVGRAGSGGLTHTSGGARSAGAGVGSAGSGESVGARGGPDPEVIRLQILGDPRGRAEVRNQNPELADAAEDPDRFRRAFYEVQRQQIEADRRRQQDIAMLNDDPFNPEAQAKIEELIRQEAVMENLQNALEHNPEAFGKVHMLYIDVEVNAHKVKAFVDSGAQATIMSPKCAEACGIMRLVDKRFAGIARGVGTAQIIGRVHSAQIKIGTMFFACSFTVMEGKDVDLLLGLDMLRRHQACIDLRRNQLLIQDVEVPFLGEADIPRNMDDPMNEPTVEGPGGTRVGARSGAVVQAGQPTPGNAPGPPSAAGAAPRGGRFQGPGQALGAGPRTTSIPSLGGPQPAGQGPPGAPPAPPAEPSYPAEAIAQLEQLGFSRQQAIAALEATGGNVDYAAGLLFQDR
ncbi:MAG: DNA damage-inducible protein 1 [Thelocarpon superellum]|nr:MAG: DNA damage-inducible protein 1 [Thelocarpon superellum]